MSQAKDKNIRYLGLKLFAAVVIGTGLVFVWSSTNHKNNAQVKDTWVDDAGYLHVLNIKLGKTTLRDAEIALKSRSDIAMYVYPQEHVNAGMRLEAYFPSIADHSKVILELKADELTLKQLQMRATMPHIYPNTVARMNLNPEDLPRVQLLTVEKLTLIPSIDITPELLEARFGEPENVITGEETVYYYPSLGLTAQLKKEDAARLLFQNPKAP
ncbi:hypothetical protein MMIC_P0202 [Mariprofundus micogutta]|uniref:Uncharacterized protein n=1 Tax=Mariprofundus micogutta TaxID=1921010 RepID=A0A1L8CK76_9PROT|nr:hypothetical protein [Mariprofundus micogutta]GAV19269.1 hypothetical protein MMIC_P0202 [Mariprofundus micogutta]